MCGKAKLPDQDRAVKLAEGVGHYSGVMRCGSVWACPACSAKIRDARAKEVTAAAERCIRDGGEVWMVSLTLRHFAGMALALLLGALPKSWKALTSGRAWAGDPKRGVLGERERVGVLGYIRATEVTWGENGWHPHLHILLFFRSSPDPVALAGMMQRWDEVWRRWALKLVGVAPSKAHGIDWQKCSRAAEAGEYVTKVQDNGKGWSVGSELARGDLKAGKLGGATPMELLEYFDVTGDMAALDLWHEYERATKGKRALTWSKGLRLALLDDEAEKTDEELAEEEVGGETVATFDDESWAVVVQVPGMYGNVLRAAEDRGWSGVVDTLAPYGVTPSKPVCRPRE